MMLTKKFQNRIGLLFKALLVLAFCAAFGPWFDVGFDMSPVRGLTPMIQGGLIVPFAGAAVFAMLYEYETENRFRYGILTEISFVALFALYLRALTNFEMFYQPALNSDYQTGLSYGISCADPFFWISAAFATAAFIIFQFRLFRRKTRLR